MLFQKRGNMNDTHTSNGENALSSTLDKNVDLFFNVGSSRTNEERVRQLFQSAMIEDSLTATSVLAWARDIRGGAGERKTFRNLLKETIISNPQLAEKLLSITPTIGRYDDLKVALGTSLEDHALDVWIKDLKDGNELAFKWVSIKKDTKLRKKLGMSPRDFRKFVVKGRPNIVETKMCKKDWKSISYPNVPSVCMKKNSKAFDKNDNKRYNSWLNDVDTKVNASTLYPYDIFGKWKSGERTLASKQWENLNIPMDANILPMIDVSGSMKCPASKNITCYDVAVSLGMYVSHNSKGRFKNYVLNFSQNSELIKLSGNINEDFRTIINMPWGYNTNFQAAYQKILKLAKDANAPQSAMPEYLVVFSDMQFDEAQKQHTSWSNRHCSVNDYTYATAQQKMSLEFQDAGYKLPKVIYWNLNGGNGSYPTSSMENDVALVSGFSPNIMASVINANLDDITPKAIMESSISKYKELLK
jgi:hypothetical protein